jgi:hypothetical protein
MTGRRSQRAETAKQELREFLAAALAENNAGRCAVCHGKLDWKGHYNEFGCRDSTYYLCSQCAADADEAIDGG